MLAELVRRLGIVLAIAMAVDDVVGCRAVALAGDLGRVIGQQCDIASQDDLDRAIHPTGALRNLFLALSAISATA